MDSKNYLFLCKDNLVRSKIGAKFFKKLLKKNGSGKVYSAGIGFLALFFGRKISRNFLKKMDVVFVMQRYMKEELIKKYRFKGKVIVLKIPNEYWLIPIPPFKSLMKLKKVFEKKRLEKFI